MTTKVEIQLELRKEMLSTRGTLYKIFEGHFFKSVFSQIHQSYLDRSLGRSDKYGQEWSPLEPYTIRRKKARGFGSVAERRMVETRRSLKSFEPGRANTRGYFPVTRDQKFNRQGTKVTFGSNVIHLYWAQQKGKIPRKVFSDRMMDTIIERAIRVALGKLTQYMKRRYG